ncbi:TfoX/Sxy family protein [Paraflavitalea speifideaquila]|uniref:TfoX/Sxy family protein n=1 Tax=Paraflavitalea speifideaquila TaxID=3076558 RepID=UPI0028E567C0|nr:TfoX/Sxy family protein [Paraflavitalea speifideiaquila]
MNATQSLFLVSQCSLPAFPLIYFPIFMEITISNIPIDHMSYNEQLADRVRELIAATERKIEEKKMFGGLCFMVNDKMCVGVEEERLMLRIGPNGYEEALEKEGCTPMDFTGKIMKGYVFVDRDVLATNKQLSWWIKKALILIK